VNWLGGESGGAGEFLTTYPAESLVAESANRAR
jgi:hypothetical protein